MNALPMAIRIPEPDPAFDAEFRSARSDPPHLIVQTPAPPV